MSLEDDIEVKQEQDIQDTIDWNGLRDRSLQPGGFASDRVNLWPLIFGVSHHESSVDSTQEDSDVEHSDERQIRLDTDRSFVLYPDDSSTLPREELQSQLHDLLVSVFRKRRKLGYFQGYHDIITVLFLTLPPELRLSCAEKLSLHRLRDSMGSGLEPVVGLLKVLKNLLRLIDPHFADVLESTTPLPYFALSNLLTLFSHDMPTLALIQHVFDYILCRRPVIIVYLAAALVMARKAEVEQLEREGEEGMIHSILSSLPNIVDDDVDIVKKEEESDDKTSQSILAEGLSPSVATDEVIHPSNGEPSLVDEKDVNEQDPGPLDPVSQDTGTVTPDKQPDTIKRETSESEDTLLDDLEHDNKLAEEASTSTSDETRVIPEDDPSTLQEPPTTDAAQVDEEKRASSPASSIDSAGGLIRPTITLTSILKQADELYASYPPSHPALALSSIMGPQSVVFTWSEDFAQLPEDDEAEAMVEHLELIVRPEPEPEDVKPERKGKGDTSKKRRSLRKRRRFTTQERAILVSAIVVVGVGMAMYGTRHPAFPRSFNQVRDWKQIGKWAGGFVMRASEGVLRSVNSRHQ